MQSDYVILRNNSDRAQFVFWKGNQIILAPGQEDNFAPNIAEYFLKQCSPYVEHIDLTSGSLQMSKEEPSVLWVANITGNPDASQTFSVNRRNSRTNEFLGTVQIENNIFLPRVLKYRAQGSEIPITEQDGTKSSIMLGPTLYEIMPFKRLEFPTATAKWLLQRESLATNVGGTPVPGRQPALIRSRPPSAFEPASATAWPIDQMRCYLYMCDASVTKQQLGPSEAQLAADAKGKSKDELEKMIRNTRFVLWKRLFTRLVDPRFRLPTKEEFDMVFNSTFEKEANSDKTNKVVDNLNKSAVR
jgi:hypothetical protein